MNYTINEIPDEATDANNGDYLVMWQGKTKKVSILNLLKTLVKKSEVTNTVSATSDNVITSKAVSSLLTISASNTTITNAPPLQNGTTIRFFFTSQITGSDDTTAMSISYNGTSYSVKATSNGSLKNFTAYPIATEQTRNLAKGEKTEEEKGEAKEETKGETKSGTRATVTTYVYCQAYTTLEMMFDGTKFIIMGNPVVISNSDYTVYTDGSIIHKSIRIDEINVQWFIGQIVHIQNVGYVINVPLSTEIIKRYNIDVVSADLSGVIDLRTYITEFAVMNNAIQVATNYPSMAAYVNSQANIQLTFSMKI